MKNKILILVVASMLAIVGFSGCKDVTTAGVTDITYYPTLTVQGDPVVIVDKGANYQDAGAEAMLNGEDVSDQIVTTSTVDTSTPGIYSVTYKITNADGISRSGSRTVYVADPTPSIISSGIHTIGEGTYRLWLSSGKIVNFSGYNIVILQTEPGKFYITDFMGGYYDQHAGYGPQYAMNGYFQLNADNTITPLSSHVPAWGDSMDGMSASAVDPATGQITYTMDYAGLMTFNIIIN